MDLKLKNNSTLILNSLPSALVNRCETIYISNCPNVNAISLLRLCNNLTNVNCTIGNVSGTLVELQHYATLHGFNNHEEPDNTVAPTINGTFTITDWYTTSELQALQGIITGLTIIEDSSKNIDTALINGDFAIQTLDSTQPNYNPAAAIRLQANGYGITRSTPSTATKGNWFVTKDEIATITSLSKDIFGGIASAVDSNKIVSNDDTEEYLFTSFDEFKYFTGMTSIPNGSNTNPKNIFASCSNLQLITLPEGMTTIGSYAFFGLSNLTRLTLPSTITYIQDYNFASSGYTPNLHTVYFNGTLKQWMSFTRYANNSSANPCASGADLYIQSELLENVVIPEDITSIIAVYFGGVRSIASIVFHQNITSIGNDAFRGCTGLTGSIIIPDSVISVGNNVFYDCYNIQDLIFETTANVPNNAFTKCGNGNGLLYISGNLLRVDRAQDNRFKDVIIKGNYIHTNNYQFSSYRGLTTFRIKGLLSITSGGLVYTYGNGLSNLSFVEIMGDCNGAVLSSQGSLSVNDNCIIHLGRNQKVTSTPTQIMSTNVNTQNKVSKIYIGDGSSASHDQQILDLYLADTDWAAFSSKVDLWYNYNGEYRTYTVAENLINCTNSNYIDWPYITRGESYQTTIEPFEGMTLDSVTVEMYEAVDNGTTPSTPTDITNDVYDSSTGEINISAVTGNVIITASAS